MVFSSIVFLLYFLPAFLLIYYFAEQRFKNLVILVFSVFFYSWGAPKFIFVILGTTFLDFHLVRWMDHLQNKLHRRLLLALSVGINLGLLVYFKYSNFLIENVNAALSVFGAENIHWTKLALPIGISFYTFETITYVVDVYRRVHKPLNNFWDYQLYIILFPKLIAGPIIRYHDLADQITHRKETTDDRLAGLYRFGLGLGKKVLIANPVGNYADHFLALDYTNLSTPAAWIGILMYTFQIYFDFSGYSDMAIGLGRMMGFRFPENFHNPYLSGSITEFWRRWHITLGAWMRNYLYIPLGGNRVSTRRLYLNLWIVFLASGLWHGASWSFVIWGAYHGLFLVLERSFLSRAYARLGRFLPVVLTFLLVVVGWVFFRIEDVDQAFLFLKRMFAFDFSSAPEMDREMVFYLLAASFFSFFAFGRTTRRLQHLVYSGEFRIPAHLIMSVTTLLLLALSVGSITASGFNPFIYFRF